MQVSNSGNRAQPHCSIYTTNHRTRKVIRGESAVLCDTPELLNKEIKLQKGLEPMSYSMRQQINNDHRNKLLRFLMWERAVHTDVLATVIQRHLNQTTRILERLQEEKIVTSCAMPCWGTHRKIWGLTWHGAAIVQKFLKHQEDSKHISTLVPGNLNHKTIDHRRGIQQIRAAHLFTTSYLHLKDSGLRRGSWGRTLPDLIWKYEDRWYAIEHEETIKSLRRYEEIVDTYLTVAENNPELIGGAIICTHDKNFDALAHLMLRAFKSTKASASRIWVGVTGEPLQEAISLHEGQSDVGQEPRGEVSRSFNSTDDFSVLDTVYFEGDDNYPAGNYRVIGIIDNQLSCITEKDFWNERERGFDKCARFYLLPNEVARA